MATQVTVTAQSETQYNVTINTGSEAQAEYWANQSAISAADALQSEQNAATSESNAQTSANNAATSESNAADDASDAEKHAQETGAFTDSDSVAFDKGAKGYKEDAEAARDEITGKFTFPDYSDGDLARYDGTKFQPITAVDILKDKDVFAKSPALDNPNNLFAWDNFNRTGSTLGNADSGQSWQNLRGDGFTTNNGSAYANTHGNISYIDRGTIPVAQTGLSRGAGDVKVECYAAQATIGGIRLVIAKDSNNYVYAEHSRGSELNIYKVVSGTSTLMAQNANFTVGGIFNSPRGTLLKMEFILLTTRSLSVAALIFNLPEIGVKVEADASALLTSLFTNYTDINKVGIYLAAAGKARYFSRFKAYNLCR